MSFKTEYVLVYIEGFGLGTLPFHFAHLEGTNRRTFVIF